MTGQIKYILFHAENLSPLLVKANRWLKKHPDIHIWDFIIGGANRLTDDWEATIYYFDFVNDAFEAQQKGGG